jgi:hypothetical protein
MYSCEAVELKRIAPFVFSEVVLLIGWTVSQVVTLVIMHSEKININFKLLCKLYAEIISVRIRINSKKIGVMSLQSWIDGWKKHHTFCCGRCNHENVERIREVQNSLD